MARDIKPVLQTKQETVDVGLRKFDKGVYTLIDESNMPEDAAVEAKNLMQKEDGRWSPRWGSDWYGVAVPNGEAIDGADMYVADNQDIHLIVVAGGKAYRSTDDGDSWTELSGGSFTAGHKVAFQQIKSYLYMVNGNDPIARYDGSTTLDTYNALSTPGAPTVTRDSGSSSGSYTYYYAIVAVNDVGFTAASSETSETIDKQADNWNEGGSSNEGFDLSWSAVSGATRYEIYRGDASGELVYLTTVNNTSYTDDGSIDTNTFRETPTQNTTDGPRVKDIALSGNRMWATGDNQDYWRVHWTGTGQYQGYFPTFYGGGWVDLEKGGKERPVKVVHYQDGKGNAYATVLTSDPAGRGSIWQIELSSLTVGDTTFTVPVPVKIVGSVGTVAQYSVVYSGNDVLFFNKQGVFTLGSRPQLLNLLATNELSVNIRPTVRDLTGSAIDGISAIDYDGKIFASVPNGSSVNNQIMVYDQERRNWNPQAFDFGVERFLEYTDNSGDNHLLAWESGESRLIELNKDTQGDKGVAFETSYTSPLIHVTKDRVSIAKIQKVFLELGRPQGNINFEVLGSEPNDELASLQTLSIAPISSGVGWSTAKWSTQSWSDTSAQPQSIRTSSVKKVVYLRKRLNNVQFRITTSGRNVEYILQLLRFRGFVLNTREPQNWRD